MMPVLSSRGTISVVFCAGLAILTASQLYGQTSAGRIAGVILDSSGAVIPHAMVSALNIETGILYKAETGGEGNYVLYPLPPGIYSITAQAAGFRAERVDDVRVDVALVLTRDIRLEVAAVQQEPVVVSAASVPMLTQSVSVESAIVREQIESLPLNSRDFNQLVLLAAGTVESVYAGDGMGMVASNGNRSFSNDFSLDGTPNNNPFQGKSGAAVSVDVIREFKVTSGVAAAEYGQAGTQVTIVTRSGSNRFHGSAFEYHRGTMWEAGNPFDPGATLPFNRNQFGGSVGGPIRRNRTFFFFNYEGTRQTNTLTSVATVPTEAFWRGDFSSLLSRGIVLRDPLGTGRPVIAGNLAPASRVDRTALELRPYWPAPNRPGLANNLVLNKGANSFADQFTARIDHSLPRNQNLMFRFTRADEGGFAPSINVGGVGVGVGLTAGPGGGGPVRNSNVSAGWTAPVSARTVNEFRVGYAALQASTYYSSGGLPTAESLGMQGFAPPGGGAQVRQPVPRIIFSGNDAFSQLNYGNTAGYGVGIIDNGSKTLNVSESVTHARGKHTIKAGIDYRRLSLPSLLIPDAAGRITFNGNANNNSYGYSFANFLLGLPQSTVEVAPSPKALLKAQDLASYIQDDWRVSRRLTVTLGLRHELYSNPSEDKNRLAFFDPVTGAIVVASDDGRLPTSEFVPAIVAKFSDGKGNWRFPLLSDKQAGRHPRTLTNPQYKHFGPRIGFVYQLGGSNKFLVRGGYGIFYTRYPFQWLQNVTGANPPFAGKFTYSQAITNGVPALTMLAPYANSANANISPAGIQGDFTLPNNQQWNFTLERDLGWGTALSLGYVGNKGTHLFRAFNANGAYIDPNSKQVVRRYASTFGNVAIDTRLTDATSIYNAMQTEFRRRSRKGLLFQANWTWAKGLDTVGRADTTSLDVENLGRDRADSLYVRRHMIKFNATYDLPFGRGRALLGSAPRWLNAVAGGWRLAGLWTFTAGRRFTPQFTAAGGLANNRPDVIYGAQANLPRGERNPSRWFNPDAFAAVPAVDPAIGLPRFGNAGRNILIGPGINVADASLAKSFKVFREGWRLTFRIEMFNTFNHPNYDVPDANISNVNTVATITNIIKPMRQAQFAIRFDF